MKLTEEMKQIIQEAPYLSLITVNGDGSPHPIIVGGKTLDGDNIAIGIYKMETTRKNLESDNKAWLLASTLDEEGPKGFRFAGTALVNGKKVVFTPTNAEAMI